MHRAKSAEERREIKRVRLVERMMAITGWSQEDAIERLSVGLVQSVRVNTLRAAKADILVRMNALGWQGDERSWAKDCYSIDQGYEAIRDSDLVTNGEVYIQNASSWLPVVVLDPQPGESILDVCAAPGGKASHIAALMNNHGRLVVNDNSRPRLARLRANMERLGAQADYTLKDATRLTSAMNDEKFDKILLDAPCSGEGLINLSEPRSLDTWSVAHIRRLATLQKRLISQAWQLLEPGGMLVYSTCTMAPEENEAAIEYLLRKYDDVSVDKLPVVREKPLKTWNAKPFRAETSRAGRVFPQSGDEAFFVCKLRKL